MYCPLRIFADIPLSSAYWLMCSCFCSLVFVSWFCIVCFYLFVFILFLACFWFSMLLSHQYFLYFFLVSSAFRWQLNKQRADEQQQSCVRGKAVRFVLSFIWLFDVWWFFSLYFIHFFPRVYLFCTCKIQKCHLDFSLWNRFSMFKFFFFCF